MGRHSASVAVGIEGNSLSPAKENKNEFPEEVTFEVIPE